ncbi:hypothetical protein GCM10011519_02700 [Marmoricola endophyticus]|uniref:DUF4235 domain-containing protein n=1 Tax=Marmoricola endophyticus TaxID=2040280 RepID=A0A917B9P0_9ACTN|nr:DUF4235 domain-containing protein [Marmoricola endophyticus]GGF32731.1 hypothetical protein GCM10011519_02700 [Marmoricola endophyticus]
MAKKGKKSKDLPKDSSKVWSLMSLVVGVGAASVTRKALNGGWKAATGKEPPANPADPDVALREAVVWATVSGTAVAVIRMLATRRAAGYYVKSTGHLPPELEADDVRAARYAAAEAGIDDGDDKKKRKKSKK